MRWETALLWCYSQAPRNIWDLLSALRRLPTTRGTGKMHFHLAPWSIRETRPTDPGPCPNEGACATGLPHCGLESLQEPFPKLQSLCTSQDLLFCLLIPGRTRQCFYGTQVDSISGSRRSLTEGNGNPLQSSCLENPHGQSSLAGYSPRGHRVRHDLIFLRVSHWHFFKWCVVHLLP